MIVKCPKCKTKYDRPGKKVEKCGVCETVQTFVEVKEKAAKKVVKRKKKK